MKNSGLVVLLAVFFAAGMPAKAQDSFEAGFQLDLMSRYLWRGIDQGKNYVSATVDIGWKGFSFEVFGGTENNGPGSTQEIDVTVGYEWNGFQVGVTDYWWSKDNPRYFSYRMPTTGHVWEVFAGYDFGPVKVAWYTNFAGLDVDSLGSRQWSSCLELTSAELEWAGLTWQAQVDIVPWASDYYDTEGFAVTHVSLKAAKDILSNERFRLPVYMQLTATPVSRKLYCVAGLRLEF